MKKQPYYGGFFWVSAISFFVPVFVAYAAFNKLTPTTKPTPQPDVSGVDHNVWDYLLRTYVAGGLVDYNGMSKDYLFTTYLRQIAGADPSKLTTREDQLALHCNAYNALVINGVISNKIHRNEKNVLSFTPKAAAAKIETLEKEIAMLKRSSPESDPLAIVELSNQVDKLRQDSQFFKLKEHVFANETISLDHLEQELIRPVFQEPRIHVALVCAAKSCPPIRAEAYVGDRLEAQLQDQALQFANKAEYVRYDAAAKTVQLSPLLKWYADDWSAAGGVLAWLTGLVQDEATQQGLQAASNQQAEVAFNTYDWSLNSQAGSLGSASSKGGGGFGSGSVPNE